MSNDRTPLVVDLDGTLVLGDTLHESLLGILRTQPLNVLLFPSWLLGGKSAFKRAVASRHVPDPSTLAYNHELLDWLAAMGGQRERILCTAADSAVANAVARHTGVFDAVLASDGQTNLSGPAKAQLLVERYGERGFDYAGNDQVDLPVWRRARRAVVVNAHARVEHAAQQLGNVEKIFRQEPGGIRVWLRALRLHQWAKNLLLFVPLLTAHLVLEPEAIAQSALAFIAFGLCASSVYLLNDLLDLPADRLHPRKRRRPFAAGQLSALSGLMVIPILLAAAFTLAWLTLPQRFVMALGGYYALTFAYTFWLKRVEMLDVVVLAALYTARIIAGTFALALPLSFWLLAFSMFLFLSLALVKRYTELALMRERGRSEATGRGYSVDDLPMVAALGGTSGYLSVLVLALYINSPVSEHLYSQPKFLWLLCPLLLYWISRTWLLTHRGQMHDDPLVYALRDRVSLLTLVLCLIAVTLAV